MDRSTAAAAGHDGHETRASTGLDGRATAPGPRLRPRIIILGAGFAGAYCAQALEHELARGLDAEVLLIDRHNYFIFYPLLIEAGTGSLEPRHAVVSIRKFLKRTQFLMAEVIAVDPRAGWVEYRVAPDRAVERITCDHLVVATGSVTRLPDVPGLRENGFEIKNMADAVALRDRAIQLLELAQVTADPAMRREILHWIVVGGNFTGVELAAEFHAFLRRASKAYCNVAKSDVRITLVERGDRILQPLGDDLSDYAYRNMTRRGIDIRLRHTATEIGENRVVVKDVQSGKTEVLRARTVVWCAGIQPPPIINAMGLPTDARGYVECERDLRVKGFDSVWGIGDSAVNRGPDGEPYPATAQHGIREGRWCARNIARVLRGLPTRPCDIQNRGQLAALGCRTGVAKVFGVKLSGFPAWFLWRTVYLFKMPGWARRIRMALDWTMDLFLPREDVAFNIHRPSGLMAGPAGAGPVGIPEIESRERRPAPAANP